MCVVSFKQRKFHVVYIERINISLRFQRNIISNHRIEFSLVVGNVCFVARDRRVRSSDSRRDFVSGVSRSIITKPSESDSISTLFVVT